MAKLMCLAEQSRNRSPKVSMIIEVECNRLNGCLSNFVCGMYGIQLFFEKNKQSYNDFIDSKKEDIYFKFNNDNFESSMYDNIFHQNITTKFTGKKLNVKEARIGGRNCALDKESRKRSKIDENVWKTIFDKMTLNNTIQEKIFAFLKKNNINNSTLGVHFRMTDSNYQAKHHGSRVFTHEDYIDKIESVQKKYENIFICSDNEESIHKMIRRYGSSRISYVEENWRVQSEGENSTPKAEIRTKSNPHHCSEAFLDMLLLSKCSGLVCRLSSISYCAAILSNSIKQEEIYILE